MDRRVSNGATSADVQSVYFKVQDKIGQALDFELAKISALAAYTIVVVAVVS